MNLQSNCYKMKQSLFSGGLHLAVHLADCFCNLQTGLPASTYRYIVPTLMFLNAPFCFQMRQGAQIGWAQLRMEHIFNDLETWRRQRSHSGDKFSKLPLNEQLTMIIS